MSITKKIIGIILILIGCGLVNLHSSNKTNKGENPSDSPIKSALLDANREQTIYKGITLLPEFSNNSTNEIYCNNNYINNWDENKYSLEALKRKIETTSEIKKLSKRLGITISDTTNLKLYEAVSSWLGTRYKWGGSGRKGIDCSGYADAIYSSVFHIKIPRKSTIIAQCADQSVPFSELKPGDLVFFSTFHKKYINHVGIYLGNNYFTHSSIKRGVIVTPLKGYYKKVWRKGGRYNN